MVYHKPRHVDGAWKNRAIALASSLQADRSALLRTTVMAITVTVGVIGVLAFQPTASAPVTPTVVAAPEAQQVSVPHDIPVREITTEQVMVLDLNAGFNAEELAEIQALVDQQPKPSGNPFGGGTEYAEALAMLDNAIVQSPFHGNNFPPVSSGYGPRWGKFHHGTDYAAPAGTPLYPISYGIVTYQYRDAHGANVITVDHMIDGERYRTLYAHMLDGASRVEPGQVVTPNQILSEVGSTGFSTGPHLHFEIILADSSVINPHKFLQDRTHADRRERDWSFSVNDDIGLPPDYNEQQPERDARPEEPDPSQEPEPTETPEPSEEPDEPEEPIEDPDPSEEPEPSQEPEPTETPESSEAP